MELLHNHILKFFRFPGPLFRILLLHPAYENNADDDDIGDITWNPHDEPAQLLVCGGGNSPDTRRSQVGSVQRWREGEARAKGHHWHSTQEEIEYLPSKREARQPLLQWAKNWPPVQHAKGDEGEVFQDMNALIL